jgi:glutathione S-transferase
MGLDGENLLERQLVAEALSFMTSEVHANWAPFFRPHEFIDNDGLVDEIKNKTIDRLSENYAELDRQLADSSRIVLGRATVADAYLYVLTRWLRFLPSERFQFNNLSRHTRVMENDSIVMQAVTENEVLSNSQSF